MNGRTGLVLQLVEPLATLRDFCDVLPHDTDGVIDLLLDSRGLRVALASRVRGGAATGQVGVIGFRPRERRCTMVAKSCREWVRREEEERFQREAQEAIEGKQD